MKSLLLRRLAVLLPTLLLVSMMVFGLQKLLPGDPALALAGEERNPEVVEYLRQKYRFNDPIPVQYAVWLKALVHGDFGTSVRTRLPIGTMLVGKIAGDQRARDPVDAGRAAPRAADRDLRGAAARDALRLRRQSVRACRTVDPAFLAGDHADPSVLGEFSAGFRPEVSFRRPRAWEATCFRC